MVNTKTSEQGRTNGGRFKCAVSPEEAKVVWESMERPSGKKVAAHFMEKDGRKVSKDAIIYWFKRGWVKGSPGRKYTNPLRQIEKMMPVMTGMIPAEILNAYAAEGSMDIHEAVRLARQNLVMLFNGVVCLQTTVMPQLIKTNPDGLANMIKATASLAQTVNAVYNKFVNEDRETVEVVTVGTDNDDMKEALSAWEGAAKKQ